MKKPTKTLTEIFLEVLAKRDGDGLKNYDLYTVFILLFELIDKNILESNLNDAYKHRKKGGWFTSFHKNFRSVGMFDNCFKLNPAPTIEKKEQQELNRLNKELERVEKLMDKYEKKIRATVPAVTDPTYVQKEAEYSVLYKMKSRELYPHEKHRRRRELISKVRAEEKQSINGVLDMIVWNMVHVDKKNILHEALERTFNEYEFLNRKKTKKVVA